MLLKKYSPINYIDIRKVDVVFGSIDDREEGITDGENVSTNNSNTSKEKK